MILGKPVEIMGFLGMKLPLKRDCCIALSEVVGVSLNPAATILGGVSRRHDPPGRPSVPVAYYASRPAILPLGEDAIEVLDAIA